MLRRVFTTKGGGWAHGEFLIVKAPTLCSDTWHCIEHKELNSTGRLKGKTGKVRDFDIDRVEYWEVYEASSDDSLTPEERAEHV